MEADTTNLWSAAGTVFVVIALSALSGTAVWEHQNRKEEHEMLESLVRTENESIRQKMDSMICTSKLNLFFQTLPKGQVISWQDIPNEYWPCMPKNFVEERKSIR